MYHVRERSSFDELHRIVMKALIETGAENGHDVLVVQERGSLRLELKPLPLARVERGGRGQNLECDAPAQRKLQGLINYAHSTAADLTDDSEFAKAGRRHRIGGGSEARIRTTHQPGRRLDQLEPVDPGGKGTSDRRRCARNSSRSGRRPFLIKSRYSSSASTTRGSAEDDPEPFDAADEAPVQGSARLMLINRPRSDCSAVQSKPP